MSDMLVVKNNDTIYLTSTIWYSTSIIYDDVNNQNNFPLRVINNKYGKVIIHVNSIARDGQIILAHSETILKKNNINRTFLRDIYLKEIIDILKKESNFSIHKYIITIVFKNRIYILYDDGSVIEKEEYSNDGYLYLTYKENKSNDIEKKLIDSLQRYNIINNNIERIYSISINSNDYKINFNVR